MFGQAIKAAHVSGPVYSVPVLRNGANLGSEGGRQGSVAELESMVCTCSAKGKRKHVHAQYMTIMPKF